ncbi:MAG: nicotinate-nucleotide diphosphorylase (carboxylating), partial [Myxococcales bacterium]|nr:nicotinate-nucleotide diphosphorylase (carboxylating) [Myxococcales bacterium]
MNTTTPHLARLIELALTEDIGHGDVTSLATIPADALGSAIFIAKEELVLSGVDVVERVFQRIDPEVELVWLARDGERIADRATIARLSGRSRSLLTGERTALNFLQRLSGIATQTRRWVELLG